MLDIRPWAILAQIINFAVLMWVLHTFLFRPIREVLEARRQKIEGSFKEIAAQQVAMEKLKEDYNQRIEGIENELQEMKRKVIREAQKNREEILAEARRDAESILAKNRIRMENESLLVLDQLRDHLVNLTTNSVEKLLKDSLDDKKQLEIIDQVLADTEKLSWQKK
jgi:F-type H+-transporting ATPase subunit b